MAHSEHATLMLLSEVLALGVEDVICVTDVPSESLLEVQHPPSLRYAADSSSRQW